MRAYYDDRGAVVQVTRGLGDTWIVARGRHRIKSPALPVRRTAMKCQRDLDAYAQRKGWRAETPCDLHPPGGQR